MAEERIKIVKESNKEIVNSILEFISYKSRVTKLPTNEKNKIRLGGISFWLSTKKDSGETFLLYDQHPNDWDQQKIKDEIYLISHEMYTKTSNVY